MPYILDPAVRPDTLGLYTVAVTALPAFGAAVRSTSTSGSSRAGGRTTTTCRTTRPRCSTTRPCPPIGATASRPPSSRGSCSPSPCGRSWWDDPERRARRDHQLGQRGRPRFALGRRPRPHGHARRLREHQRREHYRHFGHDRARGGLKYGAHYAIVVKAPASTDGGHRRSRPRRGRQPRTQGSRHDLPVRVPDLRSGLAQPAGTGETFLSPGIVVLGNRAWLVRTSSTPAPSARSTCRIRCSRARWCSVAIRSCRAVPWTSPEKKPRSSWPQGPRAGLFPGTSRSSTPRVIEYCLPERPPDSLALEPRIQEHALHLAGAVVEALQRHASGGLAAAARKQKIPIRGRVAPRQPCQLLFERRLIEVRVDQIAVFDVSFPVPRDEGAHQLAHVVKIRDRHGAGNGNRGYRRVSTLHGSSV